MEEIIMDIVVVMHVVTCICICATVVISALVGLWFARIRYDSKKELLEMKLKYEESQERGAWERKMQWEEKVSVNLAIVAKEKNMDLENKVLSCGKVRIKCLR